MTKTITEYETPRLNRMISTEITSAVRVFFQRDDKVNHRWFKVASRDDFLEDLFEATGFDLRMRTDPETSQTSYPTYGFNQEARIDLDYIANLQSAPVIYDTDGETVLVPAVLQGPHVNFMVTPMPGQDFTESVKLLNVIQKKFQTDGVMKQDRTTTEKDETIRLAAAGKSKSK